MDTDTPPSVPGTMSSGSPFGQDNKALTGSATAAGSPGFQGLVAGSVFGGAQPTAGPSSLFASVSPAGSSTTSKTLFSGMSADQSSNLFGKTGLLSASSGSVSSFGASKTLFGKTVSQPSDSDKASKRTSRQSSNEGQAKAHGSLFSGTSVSSAGNLFSGKPSSVLEKEQKPPARNIFSSSSSSAGGSGLFGKPTQEQKDLFGKSRQAELPGESRPVLFGKRVKDTGEEEFEADQPKADVARRGADAFKADGGKTINVFEKPAVGLFGKASGEDGETKPVGGVVLFGKSSGAVDKEPGHRGQFEGGNVFGKRRSEERVDRLPKEELFGQTSRSFEGERKLERRIERSPLSQRQAVTMRRPTQGLFGKGVQEDTQKDFEKPVRGLFGKGPSEETGEEEGGMKRPRPIFTGGIKSSRMSDAARRSVKKSITISNARGKSRDEDLSSKTAIICQEVPNDFNNRSFLMRHFSKFGQVRRVDPNIVKGRATVRFQTHEQAATAKRKGRIFRTGRPGVTIFFSQSSSVPSRDEEEQRAPMPGLFGKPKLSGASSRSLFPEEVDDELEALRGTPEDVHFLRRPEELDDIDRPRPIQTVTSHRSPVKSRPDAGVISNIRMLPQEARSSPVRGFRHDIGGGRQLVGSSGATGAYNGPERINILEERDKQIRQGIQKVSRLEKAKAVIGACPDMCPEKERYLREDRRRLSVFEMVPGTNIKGQNPKLDHTKAVKEYSRSSADQDEPLPNELRPPPVLAKTMDYMVNNIMDLGVNNWSEWYDFVWNRTRGIRKDITQQHLCDLTAVDLVEKCVRFHIYCAARLVEEDMMVFDAKINTENLTKCLQTLKELYYDLENKKNIRCPNEAELRCYMTLMNLNEGDTLREVQNLPEDIRGSPAVKFALETYHALDSNNYIRYFKLVKKATFLQACIMHRYFSQVRRKALRIMLKALHKRTAYPLEDLVRQLAFEDFDDAAFFCEEHGLEVQDGIVLLNKSDYITPEVMGTFRRAEVLIESKLEVSVGEIVNGGPLPVNVVPTPSSSFDDSGRIVGDIPKTGTPDPVAVEEADDDRQPIDVATIPALGVMQDRKLPNEVIKDLAKELFLEVIDDLALQASRDVITEFILVTECKLVADESCEDMAREISVKVIQEANEEQAEQEMRRKLLEEKQKRDEEKQKLEHERLVEEGRRQDLILEICQQAVDDIQREVLVTEALEAAKSEYRVVQSQLQEESKQRTAVVIGDEMTGDVCHVLAEEIAEDVFDLAVKKQELEDVKYSVELLRVNNCFKIWRKRYIKLLRLKTAMQNFPSAPSKDNVEEQVANLLPWRPSDEISDNAFYVGKRARLSVEPPRTIHLRQKVNMNRIDLKTLVQNLRHERSWKPLDLPQLVSEKLVVRLIDMRDRKKLILSEPDLYWKVLVVEPGYMKNSIICDWVKHKLQRGISLKARNYRKGKTDGLDVLSLYSSSIIVPAVPLQAKLHICVSTTTTEHLQSKDIVMGTSVAIGFVSCNQTEKEKVRVVKDLGSQCWSAPLLVISDGAISATESTAMMAAVEEGRLHLISVEDVEKYEASILIRQGLQWAAESCPEQPELERRPLRNFIDEFLFKEFYTPVYQNLAARKNKGLPHQSPNVLVNLYQSAVNHLSVVAGSLDHAKISWPPLEFSCTNPDLPAQDWNTREQLDYLEELILSISLPHFVYQNYETESWNKACKDVWSYIRAITRDDSDTTNLYSRVGWAIRRSREQFEDTCFLAERIEDCEPRYINMPWTEIISACISYKIANLDWVDGFAESDDELSEMMVYYSPSSMASYKQPTIWTEALAMSFEDDTTTTKDCVVRAAKRKLDETSDQSMTKRTALDSSNSPDTSVVLDLNVTSQITREADDSAYELKSRIAVEKQNLDLFEKYLQGVVDSGDVPLDMDMSWSCSFRNVGDTSIEKEAEVHQSASDSMLMLQQDVKSNKRADKNFEVRLRSILMNK